MANSGHIIDADFKVIMGRTADAVRLDAQTVESEPLTAQSPQPVRAPAFTTMVIHQIWEDRRALVAREAQKASAKRLRRWAMAFAAAVFVYGLSGGFGIERTPWR